MKIFAISDLHVNHPENFRALQDLTPHPDDWLIVAGDVSEKYTDIERTFVLLNSRFKQVVWVPGNHDLWTLPNRPDMKKGLGKYNQLIDLCRRYGVLTPEDPYPVLGSGQQSIRIVPMFLLYDYSFRPDDIALKDVPKWADEANCRCSDEFLLSPDPFPTRQDWCHARCEATLKRLENFTDGIPTILVNHFPLVEEFAYAPFIPRFIPWCGTRLTQNWHLRFNAKVVVTGHLHIPATRFKDGVRFEEVSLGYPRQRDIHRPIDTYLRDIMDIPGGKPAP